MPHSRPMPSVGKACHESRVQDANRTWRVAHFVEPAAVVILEVFAKTAQRTPKAVLERCRVRLRRYVSV